MTIPSSVTTIGDYAFEGCTRLTSVTIPSSVTTIGDYAFRGCSSLTSVTISEGVTSIGDWAFAWCESLTSFVVVSANQHYSVINGLLCSKDGKTLVACPGGLTSVTIPEGVTSIGSSAFSGCSNLWKDANDVQYESEAKVVLIGVSTSMTGEFVIPNSVRFIHSSAFYNCSSLTSVTIPEGVTSIGEWAFYECRSLTSVDFKGEPPSVGDYAFSSISSSATGTYLPQYASEWESVITDGKWNGLTMVCLEENPDEPSNPSTPEPIFFTYEIKDNAVTITGLQGTYPSAISIPATLSGYPVTSIGNRAFYDCESLTSVTIPLSVTSIGDLAFYFCRSLTSFVVDSANQHYSAINNLLCSKDGKTVVACPGGLTSVTIPSSVTYIGEYAFSGCSGLTSLDFKGKPPSVGSTVFFGITATGTYLPQYASEWEAVIDANGKWNRLTMVQKEVVTLPEGLPEVTGEWLTNLLEAQDVTSGSVTLALGTTVDTLEAARLLGITPSITRTDDGAKVAAESSFEVSDVVVADNAVSLSVTIAVEAGTLPSVLSLGGTVKLMACDTLGGEWIEVTLAPSQIKLTRVSENKATLSVTQNPGSYKFFKVLVK